MKHMKVKDSKEFMEFFDPELNPEFDLENTYSDSSKTVNYRQSDGKIIAIRVVSLWQRTHMMHGYLRNHLAKDEPGFLALFDQELNPGIDLDTLMAADKNTRIRYRDVNGIIKEVQVYSLIVTLRNHSKGRFKPKKAVADPIGDDKKFWSYCTVPEEERQAIRCLTKRSVKQLPMECPKGHRFRAAPYQIFHHSIPCPYCRGRKIKPGVTDAATMDPDIELFWDEPDIDIHTLSPVSHASYHFKCPLCGYKFTRYMCALIYRDPKCPHCHDTGNPPVLPSDVNVFENPYDDRVFLTKDPLPKGDDDNETN